MCIRDGEEAAIPRIAFVVATVIWISSFQRQPDKSNSPDIGVSFELSGGADEVHIVRIHDLLEYRRFVGLLLSCFAILSFSFESIIR